AIQAPYPDPRSFDARLSKVSSQVRKLAIGLHHLQGLFQQSRVLRFQDARQDVPCSSGIVPNVCRPNSRVDDDPSHLQQPKVCEPKASCPDDDARQLARGKQEKP
ncbi:MAG: hypothetical protein ACK5XN_36380, partial [Bacteroidota bacterium]